MSRLLESIRSLTAEMATSDPQESRRMIHLRLVLSASELAMLPFELATAHSAMPGQGHPLLLQTETPVCLTREVRRVAANTFQWPAEPRILMVSAAPGGSDVPAKKHREILEAALMPYVDVGRPEELAKHLTVIENATLEQVREACSQKAYTHVHILAHGAAAKAPDDETRYGIAFHPQEDQTEPDVVSGERLASALRCHLRTVNGKQVLSSPAVVSIAACDSANVGNVMGPGASIAHVLHEEGIPLVIGSQFLLSKAGSITMTEVLYLRLIEGDDPRTIVHDVRQALHTEHPHAHDWAALVVYAAFPSNLQSQIQRARFEMARRALGLVIKRGQEVVLSIFHEVPSGPEEASPHGAEQVGEVSEATGDRVRGSELLKRNKKYCTALKKARGYYFKIYQAGAAEAWPLVQYLALTMGLELHQTLGTSTSAPKASRVFRQLWGAAVVRAEDNLQWGTTKQKIWAHESLVELAVLAILWKDPERCRADAFKHLHRVLDLWGMSKHKEARFDGEGLTRQLARYVAWGWGPEDLRKFAEALGDVLREHKLSF